MVSLRAVSVSEDDGGTARRRVVAILVAGLLASGSLAIAGFGSLGANAPRPAALAAAILQGLPGRSPACTRTSAPPGVDVTEPVSTSELLTP